ncbi:DUF3006 domain-containing protein [Paenibacillus fonticola]|uniref:DUF3006 domain-containing protein n=1 Tax=Paenibacillus fonticola TaxID=379896 RepID=UPI0003687324|nr:DUF3006 domain-containing protein [Paenibacillus fonticola]
MRTGIIEGFEGDYCIIEIDGKTTDVLRSLVHASAKTGDVVIWNGSQWNVDVQQTEQRSKHIKSLMDELWED